MTALPACAPCGTEPREGARFCDGCGSLIAPAGDHADDEENLAIRDIWLLRLRALLARARDDTAQYADFRDRYRDMAETLGFQGHLAWAEAMP